MRVSVSAFFFVFQNKIVGLSKKKKKKNKKEASWLTTTMENFYLVKSIQYYSFFISFLLGSKSLQQLTNHEHKFV